MASAADELQACNPLVSLCLMSFDASKWFHVNSIFIFTLLLQMTFTLSPFDQPHAAVLFPIMLPSLAAFYTIEENVIVGLGFVVMACVSFSALYGSHVNSPAFDFWAEWTGLKLCETLIPASPEYRNQYFEVPYHRISGPVDDERERSEVRSSISEAEYLEVREGVGENNVQNQGS
ncbi:hypothetical protein OIU76_006577 [Salix suchowensis]|nr:hypothetical protein OIU76_006577 [Salix suchowensis]